MPTRQREASQKPTETASAATATAEAKPKRRYFCEGTGVEIDHKARFAGMGFDAQLKSRLVNAALKGEHGVRYDNATGDKITKPAAELLADLGWSAFLVKAQESRAAKAEAKAKKAAARLSAEADKAEGSDGDGDGEDEDEDES